MPKDRRESSVSYDRSRASPYHPCCSSRNSRSLSKSKNPLEDDVNIKDWEDARCPVCMEHPHNAILLLCSSHEKGCRPFMCDTSYRHSNCFDQFRKSSTENSSEHAPRPEDPPISTQNLDATPVSAMEPETNGEVGSLPMQSVACENQEKPKLVCPLCRGSINGWVVVESARCFMNAKSRSCACETCEFSGTYGDLRKHARSVHPFARPTEADPERQLNWRRLERQRDLGDLLSTLQSSTGEESMEDENPVLDEESWLTVLFLIRFIRPGNTSPRGGSGARVTVRRTSRRLWGETNDANNIDRDDDRESSESGQAYPRHYVRRRWPRRPTPEN